MKSKVALSLAVFFWGVVFIASKDLLLYMGPNMLSLLRCAIAVVCLLPVAWARGLRPGHIFHKRYMLYGIFGCGAHYLLLNQAVDLCSAGMSALLQAMIPVYSLILGRVILKETLGKGKLIGAGLSILGIAIASWKAITETGGTSLGGVVVMIVAVFMWSLYTAVSKKYDEKTDSLTLTIALFVYGSLSMIPFVLLERIQPGTASELLPFTITAAAELLFVGICATAATVLLWNYAVKTIDSGVCGIALNGAPVVGIVAAAVLGEETVLLQWFGCLLVVCGVVIASGILAKPGGKERGKRNENRIY
ncbi:MAG: DMT family transporter [Emergencia sp.]